MWLDGERSECKLADNCKNGVRFKQTKLLEKSKKKIYLIAWINLLSKVIKVHFENRWNFNFMQMNTSSAND